MNPPNQIVDQLLEDNPDWKKMRSRHHGRSFPIMHQLELKEFAKNVFMKSHHQEGVEIKFYAVTNLLGNAVSVEYYDDKEFVAKYRIEENRLTRLLEKSILSKQKEILKKLQSFYEAHIGDEEVLNGLIADRKFTAWGTFAKEGAGRPYQELIPAAKKEAMDGAIPWYSPGGSGTPYWWYHLKEDLMKGYPLNTLIFDWRNFKDIPEIKGVMAFKDALHLSTKELVHDRFRNS